LFAVVLLHPGGLGHGPSEIKLKNIRQSAFRTALVEFVVLFVVAVCWNFARKTGASIFDAFGVAFLTAVLLYAFHRELS
jgi:hypothetical protein